MQVTEKAWFLKSVPPLEDFHGSCQRAACVGYLLWRSSHTAGHTVWSSIERWLNTDHSLICHTAKTHKLELKKMIDLFIIVLNRQVQLLLFLSAWSDQFNLNFTEKKGT